MAGHFDPTYVDRRNAEYANEVNCTTYSVDQMPPGYIPPNRDGASTHWIGPPVNQSAPMYTPPQAPANPLVIPTGQAPSGGPVYYPPPQAQPGFVQPPGMDSSYQPPPHPIGDTYVPPPPPI